MLPENLPEMIAKRVPQRLDLSSVSRRGFLLGVTASAGGLAIGFRPAQATEATSTEATSDAANPLEAYIEIAEDGSVTVLSSQFDMGQGSYHGLATLVVEELGCGWEKLSVRGVNGNTALYGNIAFGGAFQGSGGSTSIFTSWDRYRQAAATARAMLTQAAAQEWGVPAGEITIADGLIGHGDKAASLGAFAAAAAKLPVPGDVTLKAPDTWTEIGNPDLKRYDRVGKTKGQQDFTLDVKLPGMLTAVMIHPPKFGATVKSVDAAQAKAQPGVVDVVTIHRGVAVVAKDMWSAITGRDLVTVEWDESQAETRGTEQILSEYRALLDQPPQAVARNDGDTAAALAAADRVLEADYEFPFLAHAAMEPLNAAARMNADGTLEVWGGHQMPDLYQHIVSQVTGVDMANIRMHIMKTGGGFGRRAVGDADVVSEAVAIGQAIGWKAPVKVQWTRENDMRGGRYRPAYTHRLKAGLDKDGNIVAWENHIVGQSIMAGGPFGGMVQNGIDPTSVEGASNLPYAIPNLSVGLTTTDVKVPVLWWRSVGSTHTAYTTEAFLDEIAEAVGKDPVALRLDLLKDHPRHAAVLKLAAEKAGWGKPVAEGRALGIAVHESFQSYVAQVAEVSMEDGEIRVHRVVCAVDCGIAVNPDTIKAQMEGGVGFGLGAILREEITMTDGEVDQGNYDLYEPLRIDAMPVVEVHIVDSDANPTGVGEPGVPPIGPAVANAVAKLTGNRIRTLPMAKGMTT
ncbi:xanthine dehydrogenase family protein molybdopterin-binding subunit [Rhodospirillaceae bacterium KN72]|uniref:Xanthine dehydrogenase family protein molybdopterin-binding subunit n=2 Tax=Pacificispira spongiicola TaxID=2729598 RepID=A0A7Y0HF21_9PROT|nr:xanthine dehydrogenase family protein molybdopterin-binding subunit [Pacificispira spongiicola]